MNCPICTHDETRVLRSRNGCRERECCRCRHRWPTRELAEQRVEQLEMIEKLAGQLAGAMK